MLWQLALDKLNSFVLQGLVSCVVGMLILSARLAFSAFVTGRSKAGRTAPNEEHPGRQPKLVRLCSIQTGMGTSSQPFLCQMCTKVLLNAGQLLSVCLLRVGSVHNASLVSCQGDQPGILSLSGTQPHAYTNRNQQACG